MCLAFGSQFGTPSGVLVESLAASAVFMVLPKEVGNVISPVFSSDKIHRSESLCEKILLCDSTLPQRQSAM